MNKNFYKRLSSIRQFTAGQFFRHVATLVAGTVLAQLIMMIGAWICGRWLYTPSEFGEFGVFSAVTTVVASVAALRFDITLMLPRSRHDAQALYRLAKYAIIVVTPLCSLTCYLLYDFWITKYKATEIAIWMPMTGAVAWALALLSIMQYWMNRMSCYREIATNRVVLQSGIVTGQIGLGVIGLGGVRGIILGNFLGTIPAILYGKHLVKLATARPDPQIKECNTVNTTAKKTLPTTKQFLDEDGTEAESHSDDSSIWILAKRYKKMPLINGPNVLVDAIRTSGTQMLIASVATASIGFYNMAYFMLQAPIMLITGSVGQVFFQRITVAKPGQMTDLVKNLWTRLLILGVPAFILIYLLSPWAFAFFLGEQWEAAGDFARVITPWIFMMLFTSPTSTVFVVAEKQQRLLLFAIVYMITPLVILKTSTLSLLSTVSIMAIAQALLLIFQTSFTYLTARSFDKTGKESSDLGTAKEK